MKSVYEKIMALRSSAATIFDVAVASNIPKEEMSKLIDPINKRFDHLMETGPSKNLMEFGMAVIHLEKNAGAWMQSAAWCKEKADQEMDYAQKLRTALHAELILRGVDHLEAGGFLVTFSADRSGVEIR